MYKITNTTKRAAVYAALSLADRVFKQRITFGHYTTTSGVRSFVGDKEITAIRSLDVSQEANGSSDGISIGNACSSSFSADFYNDDKTFNYSNKIAFVECGIKLADNSFYYIPCGYFNCEKPETDDDGKTLRVSGYDDISKMTAKWSPGIELTDSTTLFEVVADIANRYGLTVVYVDTTASTALKSHALTAANAETLAAYTDREVLGFCAGCAGMSARINTVGKLSISWFFAPTATYAVPITADIQWNGGFKKTNDTVFTVESVTSGVDENVYTKGTGAGISFANPLITSAEIDAVYERYVTNRTSSWQPSECEWRGNPCVEAGDIVTVTDKNGTEYTVYVATQSLDLTGGLKSTVTCPGGDAEISFDTVDLNTQLALKRMYTNIQQAITDATNSINGANGGYYRVLDLDKDGNPDGWECFNADGLNGVRCTYGGVGITADGGKTYITAMTGKGLVGNAMTVGQINGANDLFYLNLESGECQFSDVNILGGNIDMDGGTFRTSSKKGGVDLSPGYLSLSYGTNGDFTNWDSAKVATGLDLLMTGVGSKMATGEFLPLEGWYATFATSIPDTSDSFTNRRGFRFATKSDNIFTNRDELFWDNTLAVLDNDAFRVRKQIIVNEYGYATGTDPNGTARYMGLVVPGTLGGMERRASFGVSMVPGTSSPGATILLEQPSDGGYSVNAELGILSAAVGTSATIRMRSGTTDLPALTFNASALYYNGKAVTTSSTERIKKDIEAVNFSASDKIRDSQIYSYHLKNEHTHDGQPDSTTRYGLVVERECPEEVIDVGGDSINLYSMCSLGWKAIQEIISRLDRLEATI